MKIQTKKMLTLLSNNVAVKKEDLITEIGEATVVEETLSELKTAGVVKENADLVFLGLRDNQRVGIFKGNPKGFGFLSTFNLEEKDFYVFIRNVGEALDGDLVIAELFTPKGPANRGPEARIVRVVQEGQEKYLGTFYSNGSGGHVQLENPRIPEPVYVSGSRKGSAEEGDKVFVKINLRATKSKGPAGEVVEILGKEGEVGLDILTLVREKNIDVDFSQEALDEAETIPSEVLASELRDREDFRRDMVITIDGDDTKDFDDAICIKELANGNFELQVHIADVAHYVKEGNPLDIDAVERATSVYLVDRVIPMLPSKLSTGICSLNPNVDRLALSCIMEITKTGKVVNSRVTNSVINSKHRMTYQNVNEIIVDQNEDLIAEYQDVYKDLMNMYELSKTLEVKRKERGSIEFEFVESKVVLDEEGTPIDIVVRDRNRATQLIEEFMILTNEVVSEIFTKMEVPFVYRIHEKPDPERISAFRDFAQLFGFSLDEEPSPKAFQALLTEAKDSPAILSLQTVMLRTMKKAYYGVEPKGHFGLGSKFYSHFTSPIRRYPDLQIHRIIKEIIAKGSLDTKRKEALKVLTTESSKQSSLREVNAASAERDSVAMKKAEYMQQFVGTEYEATVTGLADFGIFVSLENTVEGLIHVRKLPTDDYIFDQDTFSFYGQNTEVRYHLGDKLKVRLVAATPSRKQIDFVLVEAEEVEKEDLAEVN